MQKVNWVIVGIMGILLRSLFGGGMALAPGAHLPWRAVPGSAGVVMGGWGRIVPIAARH